LVTLVYTKATAVVDANGDVFLHPQVICDVGCETPTIHYEAHNGKKYRYARAATAAQRQNHAKINEKQKICPMAEWSSPAATEEIGAMGREIESRQGTRW
jgi:hypothetical protein